MKTCDDNVVLLSAATVHSDKNVLLSDDWKNNNNIEYRTTKNWESEGNLSALAIEINRQKKVVSS